MTISVSPGLRRTELTAGPSLGHVTAGRLLWEEARLIPPPMEEVTVPVRFKYIGEEAPRIWTEDCE